VFVATMYTTRSGLQLLEKCLTVLGNLQTTLLIIALGQSDTESGPLGSGKPFLCFKYFRTSQQAGTAGSSSTQSHDLHKHTNTAAYKIFDFCIIRVH